MVWLESKYISLLGSSLRNFKRKSGTLWNWSCTYCGDSKKDPRRARAYAYDVKGKMLVTCHNCSLTVPFPKLLKDVNTVLYEEYIKEHLADKYQPKKTFGQELVQSAKEAKAIARGDPLAKLRKVSDLEKNHPCKEYVERRQLPQSWRDRLFYVPKFMEWTNELLPRKFSVGALKYDEGRLVIPFLTREGKLFGYQGRSLNSTINVGQRYITILLDDDQKLLFGLDRADLNRKIYVFEGPIDAMFIPNSIAAAGGHLHQVVHHLNKETAVLCFDNEPRNKQTCKKMNAALNFGYKVCIWPKDLQYKDINEMVVNGLCPSYIKANIIDKHTKQGMEGLLEFSFWKKIKDNGNGEAHES